MLTFSSTGKRGASSPKLLLLPWWFAAAPTRGLQPRRPGQIGGMGCQPSSLGPAARPDALESDGVHMASSTDAALVAAVPPKVFRSPSVLTRKTMAMTLALERANSLDKLAHGSVDVEFQGAALGDLSGGEPPALRGTGLNRFMETASESNNGYRGFLGSPATHPASRWLIESSHPPACLHSPCSSLVHGHGVAPPPPLSPRAWPPAGLGNLSGSAEIDSVQLTHKVRSPLNIVKIVTAMYEIPLFSALNAEQVGAVLVALLHLV
jgi:hypothetical protein